MLVGHDLTDGHAAVDVVGQPLLSILVLDPQHPPCVP